MVMRVAPSPMAQGNISQTLFVLRAADMTLTTDQVMTKLGTFTNYIITNVLAVRKTGAFGTACLGGLYTGAAKTGSVLCAATQTWATLTGAGTAATATLANLLQTVTSSAAPIISLTTGNTGALTADIFVIGQAVD